MSNEQRNDLFKIIHRYMEEYAKDDILVNEKSGDAYCDFTTRFANELSELVIDHGEHELIRGYNKAKAES